MRSKTRIVPSARFRAARFCSALGSLLLLAASSRAATLWLATKGQTSATGLSPTSWDVNHLVSFDGPGLSYGANATLGTFKVEFGFQPPQPIRELYYVNTTNRIGNPGTDFELWPGDLLVVFNVTSATTIGGVANVLRDDVLLYRPGPGRNYTNGAFSMLLENPINDGGVRNVHALTLVERDTLVGNTVIPKGTLLVARSDPNKHMNVYTYRPTSVGPGNTSQTPLQLLLNLDTLNLTNQMLQGLDLIETPVTLGGVSLPAGRLLVSMDNSGTIKHTGPDLAIEAQDIFTLDVAATEQDPSPDTMATAAIFVDGSNVGLDAANANENLISLTLVDSVNLAPFITALSGNRWVAVGGDLNINVAASGDAPLTYQWFRNGTPVDGATNSTLSLSDAQVGDSGDYTVLVDNAYGNTLSQPITLSVAVGGAVITVTTTNDSGAGSLRQAILDAVSVPGTKTIQFNIPTASAGALTIHLLSALPALTNDLTIDGYSQPGASGNTLSKGNDAVIKIRLAGTGTAGASGLRIPNPGCAVYGLAIGNFSADGISLFSSGDATIQGNFIGLDPDGVTVRTNTGTGVRSTAAGAVIGGPLPWQRNVISGNLGGGIQVQNSPTNVIQGNYLGTDASGTLARGNGGFAVQLTNPTSTGNVIGGERPGEGNVIAATTGTGSNGHGIYLINVANSRVQGNFIGTDAAGVSPLGNFGYGIYLTNATINNLIGGTNRGEGNVIAYNARAGVHIASGTNGVLGNSIFANGGLGIDLGKVGVQTNDFTDADVGANNLQNYPVLTAATNSAGVLEITGYLRSRTNHSYRLEFFTSPVADTSTNGEGRNFLGSTNISLTTTSLASFMVSFPSIPGGDALVTATATDPANNTSEFSSWRAITYTEIVLVDGAPLSQTVSPGENASFSVTVRGTAPISYQWFHDGTPLAGATAATLAIVNVQQSEAGLYQVVASNLYGSVTSAPVALNLLPVATTIAVTNLSDAGVGSFRQALLNANANPGAHTITFNLPGPGPFKMNVTSPLPEITNPVTIDGTTQPGFTNRPVVELNGAGSTGDGLYITAGGCTIKGLAINEFAGNGLVLALGPSNVVQGNFIGTGLDGRADLPNGLHGLMISNSAWNVLGGAIALTRNVVIDSGQDCIHIVGTEANHNRVQGNFLGLDWTGLVKVGGQRHGIVISNAAWNIIGGTNAGAGNLSSRHRADGIVIGGSNAAFNRIEGNLIGTDITGTNAAGLSGNNISIWNAPSNTVGGLTLAAANVIADSQANGIEMSGSAAQFNVVQGNFIGTDRSGTVALNNGRAGVRSSSVSNNLVGGLVPGAGNMIAFNDAEGVLVDGGQCAILGNSIYSNSGEAISLINGGNNLSIGGAITAATNSLGATRLLGQINTTPGTVFRIEFFANPALVVEGRRYLGAANVTTDATGLGIINALLTTGSIPGQYATATATDPFGNTSEFSGPQTIVNGPFSAEMATASEGFDYTTGTLPGDAGGPGWAGPWADQAGFGGSGLVLGGSLTDPTGTLPRSGNRGGLSGTLADAAALRNLGAPLGTDGTTAWMSFLLRPDGTVGGGKYGGLVLGGTAGSGANGLFVGHTFGGYRVERIGTGTGPLVGGIVPVQGVTAFLVARLEFLPGNDRTTVYLNPTPGLTTPDSSHTATFTNLDLGSFTQIKMAGGGSAQQSFDEIRVGASYEAVAPWGAPIIARQPQSQSVLAGSTATLTVTAAGTTPLDYQWYFNGAAIPGANNETLAFTNALFTQAGNFTVTVTNLFGAATSQVAVVSVAADLPGGLVHWWAGDSNALDHAGTNHGALLNGTTYRAGKAGSAFAFDGTNDTVDVGSMPWLGTTTGLTVMAWIHRTNVVNRFGGILGRWQLTGAAGSASATSNTFLFSCGEGTISNRVELALQFTNLSAYGVTGGTTLPTNQWVHVAATWNSADGAAAVYLNGAQDGAVTLPAGQRLQYLPGYTTKIGSWGNSTNSANQFRGGIDEVIVMDRSMSMLEIQTIYASGGAGLVKAPIITQQPAAMAVVVGSNVTLNVAAVGVLPLAYQWNRNGAAIPEATNASLTLSNAQSTNSGHYDVVVSNPAGSTRSQSAEVRVVLDVPVITAQPANTTVSEGDTAMFSVTAVGSPSLTYQWAHDGIDLPGEANATLTLTNVAMADAGQFLVLVSNPSGGVLSQDARLTVLPVAPDITTQPVSRTVNDGTNVSFTVVATGTPPLSYQWARNGTFLSGATNATLNLTNVGVGASGNFTVIVSNMAGSATSQAAVLTVQPVPPFVTTQPGSRAVNEGTNVSFNVVATGTGPLCFRWVRDAISISGATNATLSLSNVALSASGNYLVVVSNSAGSVTSVVAVLAVQAVAPTITSQPVSRTVNEGTNVTFTVVATGTAPRFYQWAYNNTPLSGATNSSLNFSGVALSASGSYSVIVSNVAGSVTSVVAVLTVLPVAPAITSQPVSRTVFEGSNVSFTVVATGTAPRSYQWARDATAVGGATGATLNLTNVALGAAGNYTVIVGNAAGSVTSVVAALTVQPVPPQITTHPASRTVNEGTNVSFTVVAIGTAPLSYQWARHAAAIGAATNSTLNLPNVALGASGNYVVVVSNAAGSVTSQVAVLAVQAVPPTIIAQPISQTAAVGSPATLSVVATGTAPLFYQWQRSGLILPGKTSSTLNLTNLQAADAGSYRVEVRNAIGSVLSTDAVLTVVLAPLAMTDNFTNVVASSAASGAGYSSNMLATTEAGEPLHDGKPGGKSLWFAWRAPAGGLATFATAGSDFDSLLAVYQGSAVNALARVDSDDDEAGFFNSAVTFNVESDEVYQVAVDGSGGASGRIVLAWSLESTVDRRPVITNQPVSQVVVRGANATLSVGALGSGLSYQWYLHGDPIPGATNRSLLITNVGLPNVGAYRASVSSGTRTVKSRRAHLQLKWTAVFDQDVGVSDKFRDMITGGRRLRLDPPPSARTIARQFAPATASRGYTGTQIFSGTGSLKEPGEPDHCSIPGGASTWFAYQADSDGVIALNTDGSTFDTVLAVYTGSGADFASLTSVACDNDSGTNGRTSSLHFIVTNGTTYFIAVDGVDGASGTVVLNYTTEGERQQPSVAITLAPPANFRLTNATVTLGGTAADNSAVAAVEWRVTNSLGATAWTPASGTNAWTFTLSSLQFGPNTVELRAADTWGNFSPILSRRYLRLAPLTVGISGCGSVSSGFLGTSFREPGTTVAVSAIPCGNSLFAGWTDGLATNGATAKFIMPTALVLRATFVTNPFTALRGSYAGLFCDTTAVSQASAGFVSARTTTKGTYSGRLRIGARSYAFSGRLGLDGLGTNSVKRGGTNPPFRMELNLNFGQSAEWLAGRVFDTNWTAELAAYRATFHTRTNPAPYRGRYTLLLPANGSPGTPEGDGFATVTVSADGSARLSGAQADGTSLSQGATVSRDGLWPVYAPLHGGRGSVWSWLAFETNSRLVGTNSVPSDLSGDWRWLRPALPTARYYPAGFTNLLTAAGSRYIVPVRSTNGALTFSNGVVALSGGHLTVPVINDLFRAPNDAVTNLGSNKMSLSIRRSSGLFNGSVVAPDTGNILRFRGAILQSSDFGSGFFMQTNASGPVWLGPQR